MNSFAVLSDIHFDSFDAFQSKIPRIEFLKRALSQVFEQCRESLISHVVICGDIFHRKSHTRATVLWELKYLLSQYPEIHFFLVTGNHDFIDRGMTQSLLEVLSGENISVFSTFQSIEVSPGVVFHFAPDIPGKLQGYNDLSPVPRKKNFLFAHVGIKDAWLNSLVKADDGMLLEDIHPERYSYCFFGDFHKHQSLGPNCSYVGALLQERFDEEGNPQGYMKVSLGESSFDVEYSALQGFPEFVSWDPSSGTGIPENKFVKLVSTTPLKLESFRRIREDLEQVNYHVSEKIELEEISESGPRIEFSSQESLKETCLKYVSALCPDYLKEDDLKALLEKDFKTCGFE